MSRGDTPERIIRAYLTDLDRDLAVSLAPDRDEILAGIREHIYLSVNALERPATAADIRGILDALGAPAAIVGRVGDESSTPVWLADRWVPNTVIAAIIVSVAIISCPTTFTLWVGAWALMVIALVTVAVSPLWDMGEKTAATVLSMIAALFGHEGFSPVTNLSTDSLPFQSYVIFVAALCALAGSCFVLARAFSRIRASVLTSEKGHKTSER